MKLGKQVANYIVVAEPKATFATVIQGCPLPLQCKYVFKRIDRGRVPGPSKARVTALFT
jgi:hypothetical protein